MPELSEQMYCHEQICIPPAFPYLLRQYAKAAIRSQPTDLLKWSTAYFRCLSLNVPPPVKPRLEYPIPRDYIGITPGWLKALNYQLQNCKTIHFRVLWDRWIGSCLEHYTLIQILVLAGFNEPDNIPWNKFIGLCCGFLNDSLTQTMIMFCEIMTEEPEGGSAMIPLEMFLEVYKYLATIDASQPQILPNMYFTDDLLALYEKQKRKRRRRQAKEEVVSAESSETLAEEESEEVEREASLKGEGSVISCPDILADEDLKEPEVDPEAIEESDEVITDIPKEDDLSADMEIMDTAEAKYDEEDGEFGEEGEEKETKHQKKAHVDLSQEEDLDRFMDDDNKDDLLEKKSDDNLDLDAELKSDHSLGQIGEQVVEEQPEEEHRMEEEQTEQMEECEDEEEHASYDELDELEKAIRAQYSDMRRDVKTKTKDDMMGEEEEEEHKIEEIQIPAVPGIGPIVPEELVEAVVRYLTRVSAEEHGMTMPRHIRHYSCPPLEVLEV